MGKLVRALSEDGSVLCSAIDTTDIVREIERLHQPTPVVTAALGRMCTAGAIMGALLKNAVPVPVLEAILAAIVIVTAIFTVRLYRGETEKAVSD